MTIVQFDFYLFGSKASPPLEPPPGVLHARRSMYSSATKGSWPQKKNSLQCATAGCSFSRCSHIILEVFRSFTIIKSTVLTIIPSPLGFTYLLLRTMLLVWWVGASSLDIIRLLAKHLLQVCEELALNDLICSWACGLSLQSAWTLQLIWEVTSPEPTISCTAKHIGEFICLQKLCGKKGVFTAVQPSVTPWHHTQNWPRHCPKNPARDAAGRNPTSNCSCRNRADKKEEKRHKNRGWIWFPQVEKTGHEWC